MRPPPRARSWAPPPYAWVVALLSVGVVVGAPDADAPSPAEIRQQERCEPVQTYDPYLIDAGWQTDHGKLYPPGCEGVR